MNVFIFILFSFLAEASDKFAQLSMDRGIVCAGNDFSVLCLNSPSASNLGDKLFYKLNPKDSHYIEDFVQLKEMSVSEGLSCFKDDIGLSCFSAEPVSIPEETVVDMMSVGGEEEYSLCYASSESIKCLKDGTVVREIPFRGLLLELEVRGSSSGAFECGLDQRGVFCWNIPRGFDLSPISKLKNVKSIEISGDSLCAVVDKRIDCIGIGSKLSTTFIALGINEVVQFELGWRHACVLSDKGVVCWGSNDVGQTDVPNDLDGVVKLGVGYTASCILNKSGGIKCWGGAGIDYLFTRPAPHDEISEMVAKSDTELLCFINKDKITCPAIGTPPAVWQEGGFSQVTILSDKICALKEARIFCWNFQGKSVETEYTGISGVELINGIGRQANSEIFCAQTKEQFKCWGSSELILPTDIKRVDKMVLSMFHGGRESDETLCALVESKIRCWNGFSKRILSYIPETETIKEIGIAMYGACYLNAKDHFYCNGSEVESLPVDLGRVEQFGLGSDFACALDETSVKCWGRSRVMDVPKDIIREKIKGLKVFATYACVYGDMGVRCWGQDRINHYFNNPFLNRNL